MKYLIGRAALPEGSSCSGNQVKHAVYSAILINRGSVTKTNFMTVPPVEGAVTLFTPNSLCPC